MESCFYMLEDLEGGHGHREFDGRTNDTVMLRIRRGNIDKINFCTIECFKRFLKSDINKFI